MKLVLNGSEVDVPDSLIEAEVKRSGRRVVDDADYVKKAEAGNELQKLRLVAGENRTIEEIANLIKTYEDGEKAKKTETELLKLKVDELTRKMGDAEAEKLKIQKEVKKRDVVDYFREAAKKENINLIGPILDRIMEPFFNEDVKPENKADWDLRVKAALKEGSDYQTGELARLGVGGAKQDDAGFSGGGITITRNSGIPLGSEDIAGILKETAATPLGAPIFGQQGSPQR
jgi:hypothetical protein